MLPVLPKTLTRLLRSAEALARFLSDSGYGDTQAIADLQEIGSRRGLGAAYDRVRAHQGFWSFAEGTIRAICARPDFEAHIRDPELARAGHAVPRLRQLIPDRPGAEAWRHEVLAALAEALLNGQAPDRMMRGYLYGTAFAELDPDRTRPALAEEFCARHPAAALVALADYTDLQSCPEVLLALLRFGAGYFAEGRHFERVYELCRFHREVMGLRGADVGNVLDQLWYAAFRTGRTEAAVEALEHWAALRPVLKRPLVFRSLVAARSDPGLARMCLEDAGAPLGRATVGGNALFVELALREGRPREAEASIRHAIHETTQIAGAEIPNDYHIALHNVMIAHGRPSRALDAVFASQKANLRWQETFGLDTVEDVSAFQGRASGRVAVVMTVFRAEAYLERAMSAVLGQSHEDFELVVVDDCSDDRSAGICRDLAARDARVRYLKTPRNGGTYVAKNIGIRDALTRQAEFIALCDSDDVWLRNHLSVHLQAMAENPGAMCSTSDWIRVRDDGSIEAGLRGRYAGACPHSTFFRRDVFDTAGFFDSVRFGADREFLNRIRLHYGPGCLHAIPALLTLGRRHGASLTTAGAGAMSRLEDSPARLAYWAAWNDWHVACLKRGELPYSDGAPETDRRPFTVPAEMLALGGGMLQ